MEEIDITEQAAQLAGTMPVGLSTIESDTIGEILNISMGAAATAVSTLLGRQVSITTPDVAIVKSDELELSSFEPAIGIEIKYVEGLDGSNVMIMRRKDIKAIVMLLIGEVSGDENDELDEMELSAISEIMNQMMGSSSTALASFFGKNINISTPEPFDPAQVREKIDQYHSHDSVVSVRFALHVEGILQSDFVTIMPIAFTKELVANVMNFVDVPDQGAVEETVAPAPAVQSPASLAPAPAPAPLAPTPAPPSPIPPRNNGGQPKVMGSTAAPQETVSVQMMKYASFDEEENSEMLGNSSDNFNLILGVPLDVTVEIGRANLPVKSILDIRQGSLIELDRQAGDPADIMVNGQLIARGDVVVIDDNFGVRITEILSSKDIAKKLV